MFPAQMPGGSIVDAEWAYGPLTREDLIASLGSRVVSVWAIDSRDGLAHRLGSGIKVANVVGSDQARYAIIATCAHVVNFALAKLDEDAYVRQSSPFSLPLARLLTSILEKTALHVVVHYGRAALTLPVRMASFSPQTDLCTLLVRVPLDMQDDTHVLINSDPLTAGTSIMMVGYPPSSDDIGAPMTPEGRFTATGGLQARTGKIVSVKERLPLAPVFGYETNIPMPPGFSGGAIFAIDHIQQGAPIAAVGICISDSTHPDSATQVEAPGSSHVVGIQNLYAVMDPNQASMEIWNRQAPGQVPDPPFGSYLSDLGKLRTQLAISYDAALGEFVVRRKV
jgi:hypothetical protein